MDTMTKAALNTGRQNTTARGIMDPNNIDRKDQYGTERVSKQPNAAQNNVSGITYCNTANMAHISIHGTISRTA